MPAKLNYTLQPLDPNTVCIHLFGDASHRDVIAITDEVLSRSNWTPGTNVIWDIRKVSSLDISQGGLETLVSHRKVNRERLGSGKAAIVTEDTLHYGICRQYEIIMSMTADFRPVAVFKSLEKAMEWLKTDKEPVEA